MNVCPHSASCPPTLSRCDIGLFVAKQRPSPRLTAASWQRSHHNGRETFLLHLYSLGAAALLQEQERKRGRGGESVPLGSSAVTTPAWPGKEVSSSNITQEVCFSTLHLLSLYLTYQRRGEWRQCWAGGSVTTVQGSLMRFPALPHWSTQLGSTAVVFKTGWCFTWVTRVIYLTRNIFLFRSPSHSASNFSKV